MDEQWLREWSAEECDNPPKNLRREVGELLAELNAVRVRVAELEAERLALGVSQYAPPGCVSLDDFSGADDDEKLARALEYIEEHRPR